MSEQEEKVEAVRAAFNQEFEPFVGLDLNGLSLDNVRDLMRQLGELKIRHSGKKSAIAGTMKLIGQVAPEDRSAFGQLVQSVEKEIVSDPGLSRANAKGVHNKCRDRERTPRCHIARPQAEDRTPAPDHDPATKD